MTIERFVTPNGVRIDFEDEVYVTAIAAAGQPRTWEIEAVDRDGAWVHLNDCNEAHATSQAEARLANVGHGGVR
jgi:hypothetical protein